MVSDSDIADEFAEYPMAPPVHGTSNAGSATHACIGTPTRDAISGVGEATTPLAELKPELFLFAKLLRVESPQLFNRYNLAIEIIATLLRQLFVADV